LVCPGKLDLVARCVLHLLAQRIDLGAFLLASSSIVTHIAGARLSAHHPDMGITLRKSVP
jgi:hypothetical protein